MSDLYSLKKIKTEYFIFKDGDDEPFDGPMTKEQGEILVENLNDTPEPDEEDANPDIRHTALVLAAIEHDLNLDVQPTLPENE